MLLHTTCRVTDYYSDYLSLKLHTELNSVGYNTSGTCLLAGSAGPAPISTGLSTMQMPQRSHQQHCHLAVQVLGARGGRKEYKWVGEDKIGPGREAEMATASATVSCAPTLTRQLTQIS